MAGEDAHEDGATTAKAFAWFVPRAGYSWSREHVATPLLGERASRLARLAPSGPWLVEPAPIGTAVEGTWHEPLRWRPDLHVRFANLPCSDDEGALRKLAEFASKYGRLGVDTASVVPAVRAGRAKGKPVYLAEHLGTWLDAIGDVAGLLTLSAAYRGASDGKAEDVARVREWIRWDSNPTRVRLVFTRKGASGPASHVIAREGPRGRAREALAVWSRDPSDRGRYIAPLGLFLTQQVNARLRRHVAPQVSLADDPRPRRPGVVLEPDSLLGAMYLLLAKDVGGVRTPKVCRACGTLFPPVRSDQKTCGAACRQRLYRTRKGKRRKGGNR